MGSKWHKMGFGKMFPQFLLKRGHSKNTFQFLLKADEWNQILLIPWESLSACNIFANNLDCHDTLVIKEFSGWFGWSLPLLLGSLLANKLVPFLLSVATNSVILCWLFTIKDRCKNVRFSTNAQTSFASVIFNGVLGPAPSTPHRTWLYLISEILEALY